MKPDFIGAHMSMAGGFLKAWERADDAGCQALQVFTKNNMQWHGPAIPEVSAAAFKKHTVARRLPACGHASYLINLGATNAATLQKSKAALLDELHRAEQLGLPLLVLHPGNHMGAGEKKGLTTIAASLRSVLEQCPRNRVKIALETTAGQGTGLGCRFEHLAEIDHQVGLRSRIGFCFDTCHVFAAGYDISRAKGLTATIKEFDQLLGLKRILAFHFNDSKCGLGSRVDRHEHIGKGHIGIEPFREILNTRAFENVPKILETPKGPAVRADANNLKLLRSLIR